MSKFYTLPIKEVRRETADSVSIAFDIPQKDRAAFDFVPGQYIVVKTTINGEEVRRSYSICSSPYEDDFRIGIKEIPGGLFSTHANQVLKAGDTLDVMPPTGNFVMDEATMKTAEHLVGIVAGSGVTPVLSIIKAALAKNPTTHFTLLYGNKKTDSIMFLEELEGLKNTYMGRLSTYHFLTEEHPGSDLFYGRFNEEKCRTFFTTVLPVANVDDVYLCGPIGMVKAAESELLNMKMAAGDIHKELFTTENDEQSINKVAEAKKASANFDVELQIKLDNREHFLNASSKEFLLDEASKAGLDVPFACKGGVCCTCKAKVVEGEVDMVLNYALEKDEVEAGYILTCQSLPKSKKVVIDFDV